MRRPGSARRPSVPSTRGGPALPVPAVLPAAVPRMSPDPHLDHPCLPLGLRLCGAGGPARGAAGRVDNNLVELEATRLAEKEALTRLREQASKVVTQVEEAAELKFSGPSWPRSGGASGNCEPTSSAFRGGCSGAPGGAGGPGASGQGGGRLSAGYLAWGARLRSSRWRGRSPSGPAARAVPGCLGPPPCQLPQLEFNPGLLDKNCHLLRPP